MRHASTPRDCVVTLAIVFAAAIIVAALTALTAPAGPKRYWCESCDIRSAEIHAFGRDLCGKCATDEDRKRTEWAP